MASWIGGTDAQRLYQYTLPVARKEVKEAPAMIAAFKDQIAKFWAQRALYDAASYDRRRINRRIKNQLRDLRSY